MVIFYTVVFVLAFGPALVLAGPGAFSDPTRLSGTDAAVATAADLGPVMHGNLRMVAAERGIWKPTELHRRLADGRLGINAGKMSGLWTGTPTMVRLEDLDVLCSVLDCSPANLIIRELEKVAALRPQKAKAASNGAASAVVHRLGRNRPTPPA